MILLLFGVRPFSWLIHTITTVSILGLVMLMAIFVPDIRNVFGVVGMWFYFPPKSWHGCINISCGDGDLAEGIRNTTLIDLAG